MPKKKDGKTAHVWTTFSADQIDFNFKSLDVLEKMIDVLLFYSDRGATILRLDAIAYLWKTVGTTCIHLPQTHDMVRLFRAVLEGVAMQIRAALAQGKAAFPEIARECAEGSPERAAVYESYLRDNVVYRLGHEEIAGLREFYRRAHALDLVPAHPELSFHADQ